MEMEPQERESEIGDESPVSHNDEDMSDGDGPSPGEHEDVDSGDDLRRHGMLADHNDVLAKLKMQVRDIKVGDDYENHRAMTFPALNMRNAAQDNFQIPVPFPFPHPATFLPPMAPQNTAPSSNSSHSSEGSGSSQQTWSFEEQFKQVRQLYEISDDPKRKEFLDDLFSFMQKRGTPINRLPIMAKSVLDLYELYNLVIARGGLVDVINKKLWQEIIKGLHLPSSITSAAFTLRTQYMKYLYPYECEKRHLSTPVELQAAIDGNRREGRRSSYGNYEPGPRVVNHPNLQVPPLLVQQQQQQLAARMMSSGMSLTNGGSHHSIPPQPMQPHINGGQLAGMSPTELEAHMIEYMKILNNEIRNATGSPPKREGERSISEQPSINPMDVSRMTLWNLYNNNLNHHPPMEPQKEPINLSEPSSAVKRESDCREPSPPPKRMNKEDEEEDEPETPAGHRVHASATHITINSRGDARNGDNSLVVSMEINGVTYQGVLFAQTSQSASANALAENRTALTS